MIESAQHRIHHDDGTFSDVALFRFAPGSLRLLDIDQQDETAKLQDSAHYRSFKALERGERSPVIVAFGQLAQDRPLQQLFPGLPERTEDGEQLLSANSFITYTMRTLFRRGWICYGDGQWRATVPDAHPLWQRRASAVLQHLLTHNQLYLKTEREGRLDFSRLKIDLDQDLVPVGRWGFLSDFARREKAPLVFNTAFFLLEHDDIFNRHSALGEAHSLWLRDGRIRRPPLFRRGAIWQQADGTWHVGLLGPADVGIRLPNGLRLVHRSKAAAEGGRAGAVGYRPFTLNDEGPSAVTLYTRYYGVAGQGHVVGRTPPDPGRFELTVIDRRIVGLKEHGGLTLPHNGLVISFAPGVLSPREQAQLRAVLQKEFLLDYEFADPAQRTIRQALQAGPILLQDGQSPLSNSYLETVEQFWPSRTLPSGEWQIGVVPTSYKTDVDGTRAGRAGIGIDRDGNLVLIMVAGVNEGMGRAGSDSFGATLQELSGLLREAGAVSAVNLDGGGSTQAYYQGQWAAIPGDRRGTPGQVYERMVPAVGVVTV